MQKKIVFASMAIACLCLLASPGSAWEITFEDHKDEAGRWGTEVNGTGFSLSSASGNFYVSTTIPEDQSRTLVVDKPIDGCISFTHKFNTATGTVYTVSYRRVLINIHYNDGTSTAATLYQDNVKTATSKRFMIIQNGLGTGFDIYIDGVNTGSFSAKVDNIDYFEIISSWDCSASGTVTQPLTIDDISEDPYVIGVDEGYKVGDTSIPFTYGRDAAPSYTSWVVLTSPSGVVKGNVTLSGSQGSGYYNISGFSESGNYNIRIFTLTDVPGLPPMLCYSKIISYTIPSAAKMDLITPEVRSGERVKVYCYQASGCTLEFDAPGSNTYQKTTISGDSVNIYYTIPDNCPSGTGVVILRDAQGNKLDFDYFEVSGSITQNSDITFDKDDYVNGDTVGIWYSWLPTGSTIVLKGLKDGDEVFRQTWTKGGTGQVTYNLNYEVDTLIAQLVYDSSILDQHSRYLATGDSAILSGVVYDSKTKAIVPGAFVSVDGMGVYADSAGRYNIAVSLGSHTFACSADNYHTATGNLTVRGNFVVNLYITPIETTLTGSSYYGNCADYNSASPLSGVTVTLSNSTDTLSTVSGTGGQFLINCANGTYTMRASKSGYDTVSYQVTVSGDTFNLIRLPASGSGVVTPPNSDDVDDTNYSAQPYGAYGRHAFDFDGNGIVSGEEWRYAVEHLSVALGCLMFMGFLTIVSRAGRR
ncbi:MAG: hypothetical protein QG646_2168 [Euryarchaeota archaeon]|nr:hypothetical protein [Euryarchaeota archaeon]